MLKVRSYVIHKVSHVTCVWLLALEEASQCLTHLQPSLPFTDTREASKENKVIGDLLCGLMRGWERREI